MSVRLLLIGSTVFLGLGYLVYSRLLAAAFALDPSAVTPAVRDEDGEDFLPTPTAYLFSQHFSAIAAAGPIAGPILACRDFGWLPCLLWIGFGVVFLGAVHDFGALIASVRNGGRSITEIVRSTYGRPAQLAIMAFIWLSLIYVIVAFTDITAKTFVGASFVGGSEDVVFQQGGAVAGASTMYLVLAVAMGVAMRRGLGLGPATAIFVPATFLAIGFGTWYPDLFVLPLGSGLEPAAADLLRSKFWAVAILVYCYFSSLAPMWLLMQPRGHLGGLFLVLVLAVGALGILVGGFPVEQPAFKGFSVARPDGTWVFLFPTLCVTIACGACSGFHGLVCSGTTSKQIANEADCRPVGYGAMIGEALVAVIALCTLLVLPPERSGGAPGALYGQGIGRFLTVLIGEQHARFAATFGAMAFSTFVFDTLDVCTRLGRYMLQEVFDWHGPNAKYTATLATLLPAAVLLLGSDRPNAYMDYWALFGTSNQLLAGLTLLTITSWMAMERRPVWPTLVPALFMIAMTLWALSGIVRGGVARIQAAGPGSSVIAVGVNVGVAGLLGCLAVFLVVQAWRARGAAEAPASA